MNVYLPIAEMSVNFLILLAIGAAGGFFSGLFGLGGGFLVTPLLAFIGVPSSVAVGTQANQLVGTSLSGVLAHWKRRNIDLRMGMIMLVGGFAGSAVGAEIFKWLQTLGNIDVAIKMCYVTMLGGMGWAIFAESSRRLWKRKQAALSGTGSENIAAAQPPQEMMRLWGADSWSALDFPVSRLRVSVFVPAGIGFIGGVLLSLIGTGGFFLIPAMIYIVRMPPRLVSGTTLFQIVFTSTFTTILQATVNHSVDILMAAVLMIGGVVGAPIGARVSSRLNPVWARFLLGLLLILMAAKLLESLMTTPSEPFSLETRLLL